MSSVSPPAVASRGPDSPKAPGAARSRWRRPGRPSGTAVLVGFLLLVAFAARVAYVLHTSNFVLREDAKNYNYLAAGLANGHGWAMGASAYRPPGYPFFLGAVYAIVGVPKHTWTDPRLVEAFVATISVGLIGLMAWQLAGRAVMLISLAVAAVYVPLILVGVSIMTESLLVALVLAGTVCALRARVAQRRRRWIALAGLFAGLAALTRGNGVVVGLAFALIVWTGRPRFSRRSIGAPALVLAVMVLTIAPWTIRNAIAQHAFIPVTTELGITLAGTYNDVSAHHHYKWVPRYPNYHAIKKDLSVTEATRSGRLVSAVFTYIRHHPQALPEAAFWNTMRLFDLQGLTLSQITARTDTDATANFADAGVVNFWIVGLLALVGCFTVAARRIPRSFWAIPLLLWASEAPVTTGTPRFRAAIDPFVILLAACAIQALAAAFARRRSRAGTAHAVGATVGG